MSGPVIWFLIKFFAEECHADQFMKGNLYLNTLGYFKQAESEDDDGRTDSTEGVAMWWQPNDIVMKISAPGFGDIEIHKEDLAAPVSISFQPYDNLHLFCLYALHTTGFEFVEGKIDYAPEQADELQRQLRIDNRCLNFGKFAVIVFAVPFIDQLRAELKAQDYKARFKLVEYYDDEIFHGEIPTREIPFKKQKRFSYQREFRLCVYPRSEEEAVNSNPITIGIGDISHISAKMDAAIVPGFFELKNEPSPRSTSETSSG